MNLETEMFLVNVLSEVYTKLAWTSNLPSMQSKKKSTE